jgi:REP element-mobilizing transposase RayT
VHPEDRFHSEANYHPDEDRPGQAALRKGRVSLPNHAYFLTKCVDAADSRVLATPNCARILIESLRWLTSEKYARCGGFVIMPNHYHLVLGLYDTKTLPEVLASFNRYTSRQINRVLSRAGRFWEPGYYDHALRDRADLDEILAYMHENPVRAGLVEREVDWPFSTANPEYAGLIDWEWLGASVEYAGR